MSNSLNKHIVLGIPIHATNDKNTFTLCGLKVDETMSYHRGGIMLGTIKGNKSLACRNCLSQKYIYDNSKTNNNGTTRN